MGAERPWGPGAQGTVLWARHLTDGGHRQYGITAELLLHIFTWMYKGKFRILKMWQSTHTKYDKCVVTNIF